MAHFKTDKLDEKRNEALKRAAKELDRSRQWYIENLINKHADNLIKKGK